MKGRRRSLERVGLGGEYSAGGLRRETMTSGRALDCWWTCARYCSTEVGGKEKSEGGGIGVEERGNACEKGGSVGLESWSVWEWL